MKNKQRGFIIPILIAIIAVLIVGGGIYISSQNNKAESIPQAESGTQVDSQDQKTNNQNSSATSDTDKTSSITVISPTKNDVLSAGQTYDIKWTSENVGNQALFISLLSEKGNAVQAFVASGIPNTGKYSWKISTNLIPTGNYRIGVSTSENLPDHKNTADGQSEFFTIKSNVAQPVPSVITSITPNIAYVNNATFGMGSTITVKGSGFTNDVSLVHLVDSYGKLVTDLSINTPSGISSSLTEFTISIPNNTKAGSYNIVLENSRFGLRSNPFPITVSDSKPTSTSDWQTYSNSQYGFSIQYHTGTQIKDSVVNGGENISFILADNQRVLDLKIVNKNGFTCGSDTASGAESPAITLNGVAFMGIGLSKDYSGAYGHISAVEHCAVHNGIGYELIPNITYQANTEPPIVENDPILNQMLSTFTFSR